MKGYKVTDSGRLKMYGVACQSLSQLRAKGSAKLGLDGNFFLALDDGTIIDDEDYFRMVPAQTVIIFYRESEAVLTGADYILKLLRKINAEYLSAGEKASEVILDKTTDLMKLLENVEEAVEPRIGSTRDLDPDWFMNLDTNAITKEDYMRRKSQDRIRGYLYKFLGDVRSHPSYSSDTRVRRVLDECITYFKKKLSDDDFFGCFFDRRCAAKDIRDEVDAYDGKEARKAKRLKGEEPTKDGNLESNPPKYNKMSYCDGNGKFVCQGKWDSAYCQSDYKHAINPYSSRESRIVFSTWNLDHRIEKSRTVLPTLFDAIKNLKDGRMINYEYFYQLLFTNFNLKLVHVVCHDKCIHDAYCDMRYVYRL